ncbi:hypothetical protein DOY81_010086, partial [Sarcophaga bullata]
MDTNEHVIFNIKPKVMFNNSEEINLEVCFTYQPDLAEFNATNMVIMEVNLPSGYTSQAESNENLKNNKLVEKIETKNSESVVIVYLDNLKANVNHCLNIPADKSNEVIAAKPAVIIIFYAVTAPGILKSNRKYTVAVSLDQADTRVNYTEQQYTIRVSIEGLSFNATSNVQLQAQETKLIDFYPSKLFMGQYKLIAEGIEGLLFRNESQLLVDPDAGPNIYIQTDKAIYKPLDLIQFRIVILDEHTRPLKLTEPIRVYITDNKGNRVKQFKDIRLVNGVYTGKCQLSQRPNLGQWTIQVKITGKQYAFETAKQFTVDKYTLPKFSLHIEASRHFVLQDEKIKAVIYG